MADRADITPELCRQLLRYEPETGKLWWKPRPLSAFPNDRMGRTWNARFADKEAFTADSRGYRIGTIHAVMVKAHRVAWAIYHGQWPEVIDHVNGDPADNRIVNLRSVEQAENLKNLARKSNNTSGHTGVWRDREQWAAEIKVAGRKVWLGYHPDFESACRARRAAEVRYGYAEGHGKR